MLGTMIDSAEEKQERTKRHLKFMCEQMHLSRRTSRHAVSNWTTWRAKNRGYDIEGKG